MSKVKKITVQAKYRKEYKVGTQWQMQIKEQLLETKDRYYDTFIDILEQEKSNYIPFYDGDTLESFTYSGLSEKGYFSFGVKSKDERTGFLYSKIINEMPDGQTLNPYIHPESYNFLDKLALKAQEETKRRLRVK